MKDYKRALRHHRSWHKFKKRMKIWNVWFPKDNPDKWDTTREEVLNKGAYAFLKWTSTPCSCSMCSHDKYERTAKHKINKDIWDELNDE